MKIKPITVATSVALSALVAASTANATMITSWNLDNVLVSAATGTGESVIYDRAPGAPSAVTSGKVIFDGDEAFSPGLTVENESFSAGGSSAVGCIGSNGTVAGGTVGGGGCDGPFQSGKRFKNVLTGTGPVDFVFDTDPQENLDNTDPYRFFHRTINDTGNDLVDLRISLGTGVGDGFQQSGGGDGLRFSTSFLFGGEDLPATSQFPFGLFGDAENNNNFDLDGFFADSRTGFNIAGFSGTGETDQISSSGIFGPYEDLFGSWMTLSDVPLGAFWDDDDDPATDDLLIAWLNGDGLWEQRRGFVNDALTSIAPVTFFTFEDVENAFGTDLGSEVIEDLANLNVNYAIDVAGYQGTSFTLRVQANAVAVPEPSTMPLLLAGLGSLAFLRRRRQA